MSPARTIPVVILNAPGDERHRDALARHLAALEYGKLIRLWHEGKVDGGLATDEEIAGHVREAEILLLLVTASWPMLGDRLERAIERRFQGARLIPVLAGPSDFNLAPFANLHPLPTDRRPVSARQDADQGWYEVAMGVKNVVLALQKGGPAGAQPAAAPPGSNVKVLFLAAQVTDAVLLQIGKEYGEIRESLRDSERGRSVEVVFPGPVQPADLDKQILRERPTILHFSGHGDASGSLLFAGADGAAEPLAAERLSELFRILNAEGQIRCVLLNACYSKVAADALTKHVDFVIGMTGAVKDEAAIGLAKAFYLAVGYGESVKAAFELGCLRAGLGSVVDSDATREVKRAGPPPSPVTPVLHCRPGADPATVRLVK